MTLDNVVSLPIYSHGIRVSLQFLHRLYPLPSKSLRARFWTNSRASDDPRNKRRPKHLLSDIITIAILATLGGADNMVAVETYGREKQDWLATMNGVALWD